MTYICTVCMLHYHSLLFVFIINNFYLLFTMMVSVSLVLLISVRPSRRDISFEAIVILYFHERRFVIFYEGGGFLSCGSSSNTLSVVISHTGALGKHEDGHVTCYLISCLSCHVDDAGGRGGTCECEGEV